MIAALVDVACQYRSQVQERLDGLNRHLKEHPSFAEDTQEQIEHCQNALDRINDALKIPAAIEDETRLVAGTFLIVLDKTSNPEPMDELCDIINQFIQIDFVGSERCCYATQLRDYLDVTHMVVRDFTVDVNAS